MSHALVVCVTRALFSFLKVRAASLSGSAGGGAGHVATCLADLAAGRLKLLFVSPERLASAPFRRMFCALSPRPEVGAKRGVPVPAVISAAQRIKY